MKIHWSSAGRHYLQVIAFCCVVAVLTTAIWPNKTYLVQVGYALSVGTITWSVIEFGRYLVDERHCEGGGPGRGHGWPQGWRGLLLTAIGIACGFLAGDRVGDFLFDYLRETECTVKFVLVQSGTVGSFWQDFSQFSASISAKEIHLPEAILRSCVALSEVKIRIVLCFNIRNSAFIATNRHAIFESL